MDVTFLIKNRIIGITNLKHKAMKTTFKATGYVLGNCWGGGKVAYAAKPLQGETREAIIELALEGIKDGSLDSGMGFESLIGAILNIEEFKTVEVEGKNFYRSDYETMYVGELSESEQDFLDEVWNNML